MVLGGRQSDSATSLSALFKRYDKGGEGFLDAEQMNAAARQASANLDRLGQGCLLVDCSAMDDYEAEARRLFTEWNSQNRHRIDRVAVVTEKVLWHMVIRTIGLASSQTMKPFDTRDAAFEWLTGQD